MVQEPVRWKRQTETHSPGTQKIDETEDPEFLKRKDSGVELRICICLCPSKHVV